MRRKSFSGPIVSLLFLMFFSSPLWAASTGTIKGFVKDSKTHDALPGANVFLVGTTMGAASDIHGKYVIFSVPPGKYTLRAQFIGYKTKDVPILVQPGKTITQDIYMDYIGVVKGKAVVITAQAEGQMAAINQQLSSNSIENVVSADRIQALPDANAAESVGRLPGVAILRNGGEGNKVIIRGLAPKYNAVMVNGVRMAATDFYDRSVDLSMISPYMLEGISVIKAITPDQDADNIGGSVNFELKEAPEGLHYDVISQGGYNGLKNTYNDYLLVGGISNRFFNNLFGVLAQINIERRNRSSNEMGASYYLKGPKLGQPNPVYIGGLNLHDILRERKRLGGTLVMDYRFPTGKVDMKNFFSFGDTKIQNHGESFNINGNTHVYSTTDTRSKLNVMTNVLNYQKSFPLFSMHAKLSHAFSENHDPDNLTFNFQEDAAFEGANPKDPPTKLPKYARNNLDKTYLRDINEFNRHSKDRELAAKLDFNVNVHLSSKISGYVKFGGKYRYRDRWYDYNWAGGPLNLGSGQGTRNAILNAFPWMKKTVPTGSGNLPYPLFIDKNYNPGKFLNGDFTLGPVANIDLMHRIMKVVRKVNELEAYHVNKYLSTTHDYSGNEYLSAGYLMANLNIGSKIRFLPGVRYEHVKTVYEGVHGNSSYTGSDIFYHHRDTTAVRRNSYWLPMVHIRIKPSQWFDIRFAYTNTLSRPDFQQIIPRYNITTTSVSWNNYHLKPSHSENFDLYLSIHNNMIGLFTLGGFTKKINDMIFPTGRKVILDPLKYGLNASEKNKFIYTYENNKFPVRVKGIETSWQTNFWYLPGLLRGLVFDANYTHIFSQAKYPRTIIKGKYIFEPVFQYVQTNVDTFYTDRLLDQPNNVANAAVGYDYKGFSFRLSALYQSNIFKGTNFWPELRRITANYLRWDLSVKQNLPYHGLQIFLNFNNITAEMDKDLNEGSKFPAAEQDYGRTVDIGLRLKL